MDKQRIFAIVPAAGSASRMGASQSKVYLTIEGEPVIGHTLRRLRADLRVGAIVVLARQAECTQLHEIVKKAEIPNVSVVPGGPSRHDSVRCGLEFLRSNKQVSDRDLVLVHDGARCNLSPDLLGRCIDAALVHGAAVAALAVTDTTKRVNQAGFIEQTIERRGLWCMQTPQVFQFRLLYDAHLKASSECGLTDEASLVEVTYPVKVVNGERSNIKLTVPEDLEHLRRVWK